MRALRKSNSRAVAATAKLVGRLVGQHVDPPWPSYGPLGCANQSHMNLHCFVGEEPPVVLAEAFDVLQRTVPRFLHSGRSLPHASWQKGDVRLQAIGWQTAAIVHPLVSEFEETKVLL